MARHFLNRHLPLPPTFMLSLHTYQMAFPNPHPYDESLYSQQQPQLQGHQVQGYPQHESPSATSPGGASSSSASTPMAYQGQWEFASVAPIPTVPSQPTLHPAIFSPHETYGAADFAPPPGPPPLPAPVAEVQHHSPAPLAVIRLEEKQPLIPNEIRTRSRARDEARQQAASGSGSGSPGGGTGGVSRSTRAHERPSPYTRPQPSGSSSGQQKGKRAAGGDSSRPSTSARRMSGSPMNFSPEEVAESSASVGGLHSAVGGGDLSPVVGGSVGQPGMAGMRYDVTSNAPDHCCIPRSSFVSMSSPHCFSFFVALCFQFRLADSISLILQSSRNRPKHVAHLSSSRIIAPRPCAPLVHR